MSALPNCDTCGRFHTCEPGSAWKMVYGGWPPEPSHEVTRCLSCVEKHGGFIRQSGIRPDASCGFVPVPPHT
jgi:hypothetical protein